jgi:hypothetical protein
MYSVQDHKKFKLKKTPRTSTILIAAANEPREPREKPWDIYQGDLST